MKDTKTKTMKTKTRETVVAEPEMVYGWGGAVQCGSMLYFVPKKDRSFFEDMARARGWSMGEGDIQKAKTAAPAKKQRKTGLERALEDVKAGRIHSYDSVDDMFNQILGKDWKEKDKTKAKTAVPAKKAKKLSRLEESIQQVERGEVFSAASVEDMFNQILGKDWREKDKAKAKTAAPAKTARVKRSVAPKAELKRSKHLDESLRQIENGEYFEASSAEEMCEQIFGKEWRTK